jgi:integrase
MTRRDKKSTGGTLSEFERGGDFCAWRFVAQSVAPKQNSIVACEGIGVRDRFEPGLKTGVCRLQSTYNCEGQPIGTITAREGIGMLSTGMLPRATLMWAETTRATGKDLSVARSRYQEGFIRERGKRNPVWVGCYREDVIGDDGLRHRRQRSVVLGRVRDFGKREACRRLSELLGEINQGRKKPERIITFERFALERWEPNTYPMLRHPTQRNYRWYIRRHLLPFFGGTILSEIGAADVQAFIAQKSRQIAPKTVLCLRNLLSKMFNTARRWEYINGNPAQGAQVPAQVDTRERITLTPIQVQALRAELAEPYRTMVLLAVLSGLRRGELFGLRWKYVDFAECSVTVAETSYQGHSAPPKTRASRRKVFLNQVVLDELGRLKPGHVQADDLVFHCQRGRPLNPENVRNRVMHPACKRAKIPVVGWHTFRYTYATWAEATGESIKALQSQLGHTDSRVTLSVYTQPMPEAQRRVADKVARRLLPIAAELAPEAEIVCPEPVLIQ